MEMTPDLRHYGTKALPRIVLLRDRHFPAEFRTFRAKTKCDVTLLCLKKGYVSNLNVKSPSEGSNVML